MFRSLLFVPGDSEKKQGKVASTGTDVVILDLEDSVAPEQKQKGRDVVRNCLQSVILKPENSSGPLRYVRVNALDTGLTREDLQATLPSEPDGIVLPKCDGSEDITRLSAMIEEYETVEMKGKTRIVAIVTETPTGVISLARESWPKSRLVGMMWGAEDLAAELGATSNFANGDYTEPFRLARNLCLMAAKAAGVMAIDTIFADFKDNDSLRRLTLEAARDGFDAKAAIHPAQIAIINEALTPAESEVRWAEQVVEAFKNTASGVASLDGKMLDMPHLRSAQKILLRAK